MNRTALLIVVVLTCWPVVSPVTTTSAANSMEFNGWRPFSHRDETSPGFSILRSGGPHGRGGMVIIGDDREHLDGVWTKTFEVAGDCHYRITAHSRTTNVANARAHTLGRSQDILNYERR